MRLALTDHVRFDSLTLNLNPAAILPEVGKLTKPPAAITPPEHQRRGALVRVPVRSKEAAPQGQISGE